MRKTVRLTERDLTRIVRRAINEQDDNWNELTVALVNILKNLGISEKDLKSKDYKLPESCKGKGDVCKCVNDITSGLSIDKKRFWMLIADPKIMGMIIGK